MKKITAVPSLRAEQSTGCHCEGMKYPKQSLGLRLLSATQTGGSAVLMGGLFAPPDGLWIVLLAMTFTFTFFVFFEPAYAGTVTGSVKFTGTKPESEQIH